MPSLRVVILSALIGATLALPAAAQWKWRDRTGQIQYSDLPPPAGVSDQDILQRPSARVLAAPAAPASAASGVAGAPGAAAPKGVDPELEARRRKAEQEQAARQKADDERAGATRAENCARAKGHLRTLDDGMRLVRINEKGEREVLDDKQRAEEIRRTRDVIASECK